MKTLYLDCPMGAAGDMLSAALLELYPNKDAFAKEINRVLGGKAVFSYSSDCKCGVCGTKVSISVDGKHEGEHECSDDIHAQGKRQAHKHNGIKEILDFFDTADIPERVRQDASSVFSMLANAEAHVHGCDMEHIHFHEVGSVDALADVLAVCMLINLLSPERILASAVNVGSGTVKCAHGTLPVPAPATAYLLRDVPVFTNDIKTELCTPTGAALLKYFVDEFCPMPLMRISSIGYGMGTKDFKALNAVRAMLCQEDAEGDEVLELRCNIDDMTGEELGFAMEELIKAGALDVYFTPIYMKKSRPATMLSCLCRPQQRELMLRCIFSNTKTLGVRESLCPRHTLKREALVEQTEFGKLSSKLSEGFGVRRKKLEYEDLARVAREQGISLLELQERLKAK